MAAVGLLDTLLTEDKNDTFVSQLESKMKTALWQLLIFIFLSLGILTPSIGVFTYPFHDLGSYETLIYLVGSILPFVFVAVFTKKTSDYSYLSQLLHRLVLSHYNLGRWLLKQQLRKIDKTDTDNQKSVIITGLARAGTTALTKALHERGNFSSLDYSNMPFLLYPRLWKRFYNPKKKEEKERAHKDGVKVGLASVEALEEYFFKVQTQDSYISMDGLKVHELTDQDWNQYFAYQSSISSGKTYLAKNNNQILRVESLLNQGNNTKVFMLFREPLEHANSLLQQHRSFSKEQQEDPFISDYMNWLGHHEFGLNQRPFLFDAENTVSDYQSNQIEYWLERWIDYYQYALTLSGITFISYRSFLESPKTVLDQISSITGENIQTENLQLFHKTAKDIPFEDVGLKKKAEEIYDRLLATSNQKPGTESVRVLGCQGADSGLNASLKVVENSWFKGLET